MKRIVLASLLGLVLVGSAAATLTTFYMFPGDQLNYICNGGYTSHATKPPDRGIVFCNFYPTVTP